MEPMKISFGFSKLSKKSNILSNSIKQVEKKVDLIECLEGQSIKVKDAVEEVEQPLIIPLKDNQKNLLDRVRAAKKRDRQVESKKEEPEDTRPDSELSVDELAARQLMKEAKDRLANGSSTNNSKVSVLPLSEDAPSLEGEKEPTLEDYESIPISDYGLALLRGMGWKDGMAIGKNSLKSAAVSVPELRPKGLGLGATKIVQSEIPTKKATDKDGNELMLIKGAFAKVIAGPQKGNYCEVQGFDEDAGRVIIKVYPRAEIVNINELMLIPVTKDDFSKGSKILNNAKYEEYKEISDKRLDNYKMKAETSGPQQIKKETRDSHSDSENDQSEYEKEKVLPKTFKHKERSRTPSKHREPRNSNRDYYKKNKNKDERKLRSKSDERSRSSKYKSKRDDSASLSSGSEENPKREESSYKKSKSKHTSRKDKEGDGDRYQKEKKSKKHSKSKSRARSRSKSRNKHKKHSSQHRDSSGSDADHKTDKRKKNKCKSRHRRNSDSSSNEDKRYRSKK